MATKASAARRAARLDYASVAFAALPFMGMISFWQVFDGIVPLMLTDTFHLDNASTGVVMAVLMLATVAASKHGDTILIDEVARREEAYGGHR